MLLKSESCASSLPDPAGRHILAQYCREEGLPYFEYGAPVSREVLARYAVSFQQKLVPHVEDVLVIAVRRLRDGFELCLSSGEKLQSANVIVATGMDYMTAACRPNCGRTPLPLRLEQIQGKDVAVIGGGQSALETAAMTIPRQSGRSAVCHDCTSGGLRSSTSAAPPRIRPHPLNHNSFDSTSFRTDIQSEKLLKAVAYSGITDMDWQKDDRDGQLDCNPRVGQSLQLHALAYNLGNFLRTLATAVEVPR